jgi:hypothetical protein
MKRKGRSLALLTGVALVVLLGAAGWMRWAHFWPIP